MSAAKKWCHDCGPTQADDEGRCALCGSRFVERRAPEVERLRAEVKDLRARLKAARPHVECTCPDFMQPCSCPECLARRATDLRVKSWRKP